MRRESKIRRHVRVPTRVAPTGLGKKERRRGDKEHKSSKEEVMACGVYFLARPEVWRNETVQGLAIGSATEKEMAGYTGIAMDGRRRFRGEPMQGRKERENVILGA